MKGLVISFLPFAYAGHGNTNSNIISTAAQCIDEFTSATCDSAPNCVWCTSNDGAHELCFDTSHPPPTTSWKCSKAPTPGPPGPTPPTPTPPGPTPPPPTPTPPGPAPTEKYLLSGKGPDFPTPPAGYALLTTAQFKDPAFAAFFNMNKGLKDGGESMTGCCVVQVAEGFLAVGGATPTTSSYWAAYTPAGVHECTAQWPATERVWFGTAANIGPLPLDFFGPLNASLIAETKILPPFPECQADQNSWAIYTNGAGPTPPGPTPPGPTPPGPTPPGPTPSGATCAGALAANRTSCMFPTGTQDQCEAKGCCYDDTIPGTFKCFHKDDVCIVAVDQRKVCGAGSIVKTVCEDAGCCFDDSVPGTFYCFDSRNGPSPPGPTPPGPSPPGGDSFVLPMEGATPADKLSCGGSPQPGCSSSLQEPDCWKAGESYSGTRTFASEWTAATVTWAPCVDSLQAGGTVNLELTIDGATVAAFTGLVHPLGIVAKHTPLSTPIAAGSHVVAVKLTTSVASGAGAFTLGDWNFTKA